MTPREGSMAKASAVKMPPEANAAHGCEGARRVLALMLTFSADENTLTARQLAERTGIALPSVYRYLTLLRETGLLAGDERGSYRLSARLIGRSAVCVHRVQSAQQLRISFEAGQSLPLDRGASARVLLASVPPNVRRECLAPLAERDPEAAALLDKKILIAGQQGYATSEEEIHKGVWAAAARVMQGKRMVAVLTVPSPLVRAPAEQRAQLLTQVRASARAIEEGLRTIRR